MQNDEASTTVEGWRMEMNIQWWQLVRKAEDTQHSKVNLLRFSQSGPHICYPTSPSRSVHLLPSSSLQNFSAVRSDGTLRSSTFPSKALNWFWWILCRARWWGVAEDTGPFVSHRRVLIFWDKRPEQTSATLVNVGKCSPNHTGSHAERLHCWSVVLSFTTKLGMYQANTGSSHLWAQKGIHIGRLTSEHLKN
jgi:hypothetical protein